MTENQSCSSCSSADCPSKQPRPDETYDEFLQRQKLAERLCRIKNKIVILSGKGGVGKSTVAANLAVSLALTGAQVGLLDVDIHGPSVPKLLKLEDQRIARDKDAIKPIAFSDLLHVMSIAFLLQNRDDALIWRGPMKMGVIRQFIADVAWGDLDYLVVDCPPGTGDEPLSVCQLLEKATAVVVTTPQDVALADVRKSITFCQKLDIPVVGVIENMSGLACPHCGESIDLFPGPGAAEMAEQMGVPFLGNIPFDPAVVQASDSGSPFSYHLAKTPCGQAFAAVADRVMDCVDMQTQG